MQGLTYPVSELFLEDVLEKTRYRIKPEFDNVQGNSRRRHRQQESKKDPLTELFEACFLTFNYHEHKLKSLSFFSIGGMMTFWA